MWRVDGPKGVNNFQTEHWDGSLDAHVYKPKPVTLKIKVERNRDE